MGAMLWQHEVPWDPDPADALRQFQSDFFASHYSFEKELTRHRDSARKAVELERERGDRFGILHIFEEAAATVEAAEAQGLPTDVLQQIELMRRVLASVGPDGFGNILDVTSVNDEGGSNMTRRLRPEEVIALVGSERPNLDQANDAISKIANTLGRSESVCFPVFDLAGSAKSWMFVGYTHD